MHAMELKRATSLIFTLETSGIKAHNYFSKKQFSCNTIGLEFLSHLANWTSLDDLFARYPDFTRNSLAEQLIDLINNHAVVVKNTEAARLDEEFAENWSWGNTAGFYHFSIRNSKFMPNAKQRDWVKYRRKTRKEPAAFISNRNFSAVQSLPEMDFSNPVFSVMKSRRSIRQLENRSVSIQQLADCLYAAKGVTGWAKDPDFGTLPLTMTPSGGARNPYDLYVYARQVDELKPGFYHYNGIDHDLGLLHNSSIKISELLAQQEWADSAAAVIFLVADFSRSAWKYHLPPAYRIVLMEAGFIAQNIALAATQHELSAIPTGAVSERKIESLLGTTPVRQAQILAIVIGSPASAITIQHPAPQ